MIFSRTILLCLAAASTVVHAQQPDDAAVEIGQEVCTAGFVMDEFCIDRGTLFDNENFKTLEDPQEHSTYCLIDVGLCHETPFHILSDPRPESGSNLFGPGWAVSDNMPIMQLGKKVGSCGTCDGTGTVAKSLRMEIHGTVTSLSPPTIDIVGVEHLEGDTPGCVELASSVSDTPPTEETTENGDNDESDPVEEAAPSDTDEIDADEETETPSSASAPGMAMSSVIVMMGGASLI